MATRQTSSSGRPKSPRIQVVLPEELCERLSRLADSESRTVSNMAKVLIQQGVERMERERAVPPLSTPPDIGAATTGPAAPGSIRAGSEAQPLSTEPPAAPDRDPSAPLDLPPQLPPPVPSQRSDASSTDRFRSELERRSAGPTARLRGLPRRLRLRPPGRS